MRLTAGDFGIKHIANKRGMIPTQVHIKNFMSYSDNSLRFGDLTIIHSKKAGAGKTSILEALMYAFTGKTLRTLGDLRIAEIIRRLADSANIQVDGIYKPNPQSEPTSLFIERTRKKRGSDLSVRIGGEEVGDPKTFLEQEIDAKSFSRMTYINGHDILQLLRGTPKETALLFDRLFGIDVLEQVKTALATRGMKNELKQVEEKISDVQEMQRLMSQHSGMLAERQENEQRAQELRELRERLNEELDQVLIAEQNAKDSLRRLQDQKNRIDETTTKISMFRERNETVDRSMESENVKLNGVEEILVDLLDQFGEEDPDSIIEVKKQRKEEMYALLQSQETVPTIIDSLIGKIESREDVACPVCGKEHLSIEELEEMKDQFEGIHEERREHIDFLTTEIMNLVATNKRIEKLKAKKRGIRETINRMLREKEDNLRQIANLEEFISSIQDESVDIDEDGMEQILDEKKSSEIRGRLSSIDDELSNLQRKLSEARSEMRNIPENNELPNIERLEDRRQRLQFTIEKFKRFRGIISETLRDIRSRILEEINTIINDYLNFFEISVVNSVQMKVIQKQLSGEMLYRYDILVKDSQSRDLPFESLSTGQKATVLLALLMSINDVSANAFPLLLFDEIQACGLDDEGLMTMVQMLSTLATLRNIVITSRSEDFINKMDAELLRVNEDGNKVHDISVRIYECQLTDTEQGVPKTEITRYDGNERESSQ